MQRWHVSLGDEAKETLMAIRAADFEGYMGIGLSFEAMKLTGPMGTQDPSDPDVWICGIAGYTVRQTVIAEQWVIGIAEIEV
ncbi:hypothetical protein ACFV9E_09020 [Streptomyces sp. NPDC059835]|uniref:hypothetical protein n=1 Tax=Streptomyces sp. NPDC059835 TaxID=3346967 RepID=UPI00365A5450